MRVIVGVPLLLIALALILANSPLVRSTVRSQVAAATGCVVEMEGARVDLDGRVEIKKLRLSVPGLAGPEGQLLYAEKAEIDLNWSAALSWAGLSAVRPTSIRLTDPVFRLSQSVDDGSLNLAGLAGSGGGAGAAGGGIGIPPSIPTVNVKDGKIEFAEHSLKQARFELLNTIHVAGAFASNPDGSYQIRMQEIGRITPPQIAGEPQLPRGMILDGRIDLQKAEAMLRLLNVPLEAWPPESVPTAFRETWRRLRIQGRIRETVFTYDRAGGVKLVIWPENVAMGIPVPAKGGGPAGDLGLSAVNGQITLSRDGLSSDLEGIFEEQTKPVHVKLKTDGTDLNAPLVCEIWGDGLTLARNPGFLPYVPDTAREIFGFFSGPTGEVDARVTISRGAPVDGEAAPVVVTDGRLTVRNGTATFHKFRYPIHNMEGSATFDDNHLNILDIRGDGPTGAKLRASAQASPMTDDARVDVSVHVSNVPVDEHLRAAMPGSRKQLLEVLFNEDRYAELLAAGLIRPGDAPPLEGAAPPFGLGGLCEIDVTVVRPLGADVEWLTEVVVRFAETGILPKPFPFPIVAKDVEIRINDDEGKLTRGTFAGLRGGRAELSAHVQLTENGQNVLKPKLDISAFDVPVDALLINAVPDDASADDSGAVSAKAILRRLDIQGNVDCTANIRDAGDGSEDIDYDVTVHLKDLEARPRPAKVGGVEESRLVVAGASGRIRVTPKVVRVEDLGGRLVVEDPRLPPGAPDAVVDSCGVFTVELEAQILEAQPRPETGPPAPSLIGAIDVKVDATGLNLAAPLPSLLSVFNGEIADVLAKVRDKRSPSGHLDAMIQLQQAAGAEHPSVNASLSRFEEVSFNAMSGRLCLVGAAGSASFANRQDPDPRRRSSVGFEGFSAELEYAGVSSGSIELDGGFSMDPESAADVSIERSIADAKLAVRLRDARFESPLVTDLLALGLSDTTLTSWKGLEVAGRFDAHVDLIGEPVVISGMVGPREVSFQRAGMRTVLPSVLGHVSFRTTPDATDPDRRRVEGRIEELGCEAAQWRADARGSWSFVPGEGFMLNTQLSVEGQSLSEDLLGILPRDAIEAVRAVDLRIDGGFSMPQAVLVATIPDVKAESGGADVGVSVRFDGRARFAQAGADIGVPIRECEGEVSISIASTPDEPAAVAIELDSPRLKLAGLVMTNAKALLVSDDSAGEIVDGGRSTGLVLPYFTADCHGGRIWGGVTIGPAGADDAGREFTADVLAAGILFAPLLDELAGVTAAQTPGTPVQDAVPSSEPETPHEPSTAPPDRTRGQADMWVSLSGRTGDPGSRLGRGSLRVANGDVLRLPVVFPLVQMSNLMLPNDDRFNYLQAEFHLRGQTAYFENIAVLSDSVSLMGDGTATLPELTLDMRFNSRSNKRIPMLSDMYEALRDEIVTTRVRGTVANPDIRSETFTTTRSILDAIFDPGREQAGSIGSDAGARREQARVSGALRGEAPLPPTTMPVRPTGVDG